jgi:hypothetical protein
MRHLNKSGTGKAIYRGNMSIGVIGHARVGLLVAEDPDDDHLRVLAMPKINCGPKQESLRFALEPIGNVCRIGWAGRLHVPADESSGARRGGEQERHRPGPLEGGGDRATAAGTAPAEPAHAVHAGGDSQRHPPHRRV